MKKELFFLAFATFSLSIIEAQVNLQTGAANYNIPLYSYADANNGIGTSISLVYTAGNGLKVSEIPSSVGAGWILSCGGFIQRIQNGEPDDQKNNDSYVYPTSIDNATTETNFHNWVDNYFPNGYLYSEFSPSTLVDNGGAYSPMFPIANYKYKPKQKYLADLEQDIFSFNFNGRTGYFIVGKKDQNNNYSIRTLYDSKLKIEKVDGDLNNTNNIRTTISEFQITDENGIKYIFRDANLDQVCSYDKMDWYDQYGVYGGPVPYTYSPSGNGGSFSYYTTSGLPAQYIALSGNAKNAFLKNKWYLSEIKNPITNVSIQFIYETYDFDLQGDKTASKTVSDGKTTFTLMVSRSKGTAKRLKRIILSTLEEVEFNYSTASRVDLPNDKVLESISIKYDSQIKYKWQFEQGYFVKREIKSLDYNFSTEERVWARLCLQKIWRTGSNNISEPPYSFSYYMGNEADVTPSAIPPLFSFYQDAWGCYNIIRYLGFYNPTTHTNSPSNPPYEPYGGNLLPKEIYDDPLNTSQLFATTFKVPTLEARNGVLKSVTNPLSGSLTFTYEQNYFNMSTFLGNGGIRVSKTSFYDGIDHAKDVVNEYKYVKQDGSTSAWGFDNYVYSRNLSMSVYKKCGNNKYPAVNVPDMAIDFYRFANLYAAANPTLQAKMLPNFGIGFAGQIILNVLVSYIVDQVSADWQDFTVSEYKSDSYLSHNPLPFQYSRVEVINDLSSTNIGKTIYEFTSPDETDPLYAIDVPALASPFSSRQRFAYWLYGLPKMIAIKDKFDNIVKITENNYQPFKYSLSADPLFISQKWIANKKTFNCPFNGAFNPPSNEIDHEIYYPICGRVELKYTKEYIYNNNSPQGYTSSQIDYEYSPNNYLPNKVSTHNSKGELIETSTFYPLDYTITGPIQTMQVNHMFNTPVFSQTIITKGGPQKYLLSGEISEFGPNLRLITKYEFRNSQPILSSSVPFSPNALNPSTTYYKPYQTISYDANGNIAQVNSDQDKVSTIYDYDHKLPVASIVNANINDVAYCSFEADGIGGWSFDASKIVTEPSATGKKCFKFPSSGTLISRNIDPARKYTLSFWAKGGQPFVYGSTVTLLKSFANAVTGYTYYEYEITAGSIIKLDNTNNGTASQPYSVFSLDELRLYPKESRMTTVSYNPLIGKTEECDENGRLIYYEYDYLGRLQFIRDENRNIVKMYEYNYKH